MNLMELLLLAAAALCCGVSAASASSQEPQLSHRWLYLGRNLRDPDTFQRTVALLPRATAAGYNGIALADRTLQRLGQFQPSDLEPYRQFQQLARQHGIEVIPCVATVGYSNSLLVHNPNLAEGLPVKDALFVVREGTATLLPDPSVSVPGGDFESVEGDRFLDWEGQDNAGESIFADHDVFRTGGASVRMESFPPVEPDAPQSRLWRTVKVHPFRQYHLRVWIKTEDFKAPAEAAALSVRTLADPPMRLNYADFRIRPTQDWREYHVVFNSQDNEEVRIYLGTWGAESGRIWWDDLALEEIGLLNVLRRAGCPLTVRSEDGTVYEEGRDFAPIRDPNLRPTEIYHAPPAIEIPGGSRIADGQRLRVSYYHPVVIYRSQVSCCLSDPEIYDLLRDEVRRVNDLLHPSAFFMQHDEIRVANWDKVCQDRGLTPGQLLADNVRRCIGIIREVSPDARIWVWSDMFDPRHNMRDRYYLVNGSWAGGADGLPPEVGIVNWGLHLKGANFQWFSERGHEQVLAGYYDYDEDGAGVAQWLAAGADVSGIKGAMYTTWRDKFDAIEAWAQAAWGGKPG